MIKTYHLMNVKKKLDRLDNIHKQEIQKLKKN